MMVQAAKDEAYLEAVIPKRIELFESIQAEQRAARQSLPSFDPIRITLSDGKVKEGKKWITSPFEIASEISKSLASNALISEVNGVLWDMNRPLEGDAELRLFTLDSFDNNEDVRHTFWHSSSHILGQALEVEYGCKLCIGPCARIETRHDMCATSKEGFYYDAFYGDFGLNDEHFKQIESWTEKAVKGKQPFERIEVSREQALEMFCDNKFKVEIINGLPADKTITVYRCGPLVDLCRGPNIPNTSFGKMERPVMIHRAVLGSVERMLAVLLEHYKGKWPFWLSPRQAIVCPVSHTALPYALQVHDQIHQAGYYVDVDTSDKTIQKKVRQAQIAQYNYILVVGGEEVQNGQVSVRIRDKGDVTVMSMESLLQHFKDQVEAFH